MQCVFVGGGAVGKTYLIKAVAEGSLPDEYIPTLAEEGVEYRTAVSVNDRLVDMSLWDTSGRTDLDKAGSSRPALYSRAKVFVICFSVSDPATLTDVRTKWYPEIQRHNSGAPILVVGTKVDLRSSQNIVERLRQRDMVPVTFEAGKQLAQDIGAVRYLECSAFDRESVMAILKLALTLC